MNGNSEVDVAKDSVDAGGTPAGNPENNEGTATLVSKSTSQDAGQVHVRIQGSKPVIVDQMKEVSSTDTSGGEFAHRGPLSWAEARATLTEVLEKYMKRPLPVVKSTASAQKASVWQCCFRWDADFYIGALPVSAALLALSITSLEARKRGDADSALNASAGVSVYRTQVAGSTLLLAGTLISIFLVKRREYIAARDSDVAKRTTITRFLKATKGLGEGITDVISHGSPRSKTESDIVGDQQLHHSGTSRTDIYPAYRRSNSAKQQGGFWHRVPTLLLVKGDFIALQVGDVAPAKCKLLDAEGKVKPSCTIEGGERITVGSFGDSQPSPTSKFPRGKSTVPSQSRELLELCNHMSVFVVEETPLESFLNLPHAKQRLPQVHRQLKAVRHVMFLFASVIFVITFAVIFVRPGAASSDLSIVIPAPFLAALAALPVTTPACLFFLEVYGTARILMKVHPHIYMRSQRNAPEFQTWLFLRYLAATTSSRLYLQELSRRWRQFIGSKLRFLGDPRNMGDDGARDFENSAPQLVCIPPASTFLLEKLGVATAFTIIDDELVCEPYSIPQQLLIPSGNGLKLLDLCPTHESDSDDDSEALNKPSGRRRGKSYGSSQDGSDSDSDDEPRFSSMATKKTINAIRRRRRERNIKLNRSPSKQEASQDVATSDDTGIQFEDPLFWHYMPSLKCIGLACLLVDDHSDAEDVAIRSSSLVLSSSSQDSNQDGHVLPLSPRLEEIEKALVRHICSERDRPQLRLLAHCIGFSTNKNSYGDRGDLSFFREKLRVNVVSTKLLNERLAIDAHALGLEESRAWGSLRPDSLSIVVEDKRSKAYQLLTVGDPRVVAGLCDEAWQGENSTILPFNTADRRAILEASMNWALADLDVAAFAYSPVPRTLETRLGKGLDCAKTLYLAENSSTAPSKDSVSEDWALINKQIFLGVLGSSVIPRKEIEKLLETFDEAGVRFVYFSPRNMRRTKELASQMGIDVAWNCAISLRKLDEGEQDPHRMVSTYADWTVNAKLPHGIVNVRKHLEDVDNVPLLVSLFTDATKESSMEMIQTFQEYSDTVVAMGLSHLPRNAGIFSTADISVGADVLAEELAAMTAPPKELSTTDHLMLHEVEFVEAVSAHSCAFNLRGAASSSVMPGIIERARASLEAVSAAAYFMLFGSVSFSIYVFFCMCSASTAVPFVPTLGSVLYLQVVLPLLSFGLAMSDSDDESMHRVPTKNDQSITFSRKEGSRLYTNTLLKAFLPAIFTYVLYLIAFGQLMIKFEPEFLRDECSISTNDIEEKRWTYVIRCESLKTYSGEARTSAGALILAEIVLCVIIGSASFVYATASVVEMPPWSRNHCWACTSLISIIFVTIYLAVALEKGSFSALSRYFFVLAAIIPFLCLLGNELVKRSERQHIERAAKLRRLQFETRLGMWSPK